MGYGELGKVKVDLYTKDLQYKNYTLADVKVIELLIRFRYKYDPYMYAQPNNNFTQAGDIEPMNTEAIALFEDLDELIKTAGLSERQLKIIEMVQDGYSLNQIAKKLDLKSTNTVSSTFKASCRKVVKKNLWDWRKVIYVTKLDLMEKQCSKCEKELPATPEFYSDDSRNNDGFHSICKACRK